MREMITIAVPKGRVLEQLIPRLAKSGVDTDVLTKRSRKLVREDSAAGLRYLLLKPDDVPTYVEFGAADVGIVGRDVLDERQYELYVMHDLGIGRCRMAVAGLPGGAYAELRGDGRSLGRPLRVATKFPSTAARHFRDRGIPAETLFVQGSVELAPLTGLSDVIVDIVESGETLRQNGLVEFEQISEISSVIAVNRASLKLKRDRIVPLLDAIGA